jgi:hypothetical protein
LYSYLNIDKEECRGYRKILLPWGGGYKLMSIGGNIMKRGREKEGRKGKEEERKWEVKW